MSSDRAKALLAPLRRPSAFTRRVGYTFVLQVFTLMLAVAYTAVLGRWLGTEGKGLLELAVLVPAMVSLLLSGGIEVSNVYFAGSKQLSVAVLTHNSITMAILVSVLGALAVTVLVATDWIVYLLPNTPLWIVAVAMLGLPVELLGRYFRAILQGTQNIFAANAILLLRVAAQLILTVLLTIWFDMGLRGALYAYLVAGLIHLVPQFSILRRHGARLTPSWSTPIIKQTIRFGMRGHVGNVLQYYNYRLDVFFVNAFVGPAAVGIYNVSARLAEGLWFLPNAVGFVIFPMAASSKPEKMNAFTPRVFVVTLALTALSSLGLIALGRPLIRLIYSNAFLDAYAPMLWLLPGVVLLGGGKVLTNEIAGRGFPHFNSMNAGLALILTVILDVVLIPRQGIRGAAMASSAAYSMVFLTSILTFLYVRHRSRSEGTGNPDNPDEVETAVSAMPEHCPIDS